MYIYNICYKKNIYILNYKILILIVIEINK